MSRFTLKNSPISLEIPDMGHHPSHHRGGSMRDVTPALTDLAAYEVSGWWICPIGRYGNRLKGGITLDGCHCPRAQETERHGPAWRARPVLGRAPVGHSGQLHGDDAQIGKPGRRPGLSWRHDRED
jgi:hypothetical protein